MPRQTMSRTNTLQVQIKTTKSPLTNRQGHVILKIHSTKGGFMWNDNKEQIVMVSEWNDDEVDKDEAGHMIDFIQSIKELNDAMQPFKDQMKDLKANYKEQEWLDAKQQKMAMKIYRMIDDDVDLAEFVGLFQTVNKIVKKEE